MGCCDAKIIFQRLFLGLLPTRRRVTPPPPGPPHSRLLRCNARLARAEAGHVEGILRSCLHMGLQRVQGQGNGPGTASWGVG